MVVVTSPASGAVLPQEQAWLSAKVTDTEKPNSVYVGLFPTTLTMTSDRDGHLCTITNVLEDKGCLTGVLSLGQHVITATATDAFGAPASVSVSARVDNKPPIAKITYPPDGSGFFIGQQVNLRGYGFDPESSAPLMLTWESNLSGILGNGKDIWVKLPFGTHTVTLTASDMYEAKGIDSITLYSQEDPGYPTARILSPANSSIFRPEDTIHLIGEGIDPQNGKLHGSQLQWSSDIDGNLGEGEVIVVRLSGAECEMRVHHVTLTVVDSDGLESKHMVAIVVGNIC
jgi:hypothetical protein